MSEPSLFSLAAFACHEFLGEEQRKRNNGYAGIRNAKAVLPDTWGGAKRYPH